MLKLNDFIDLAYKRSRKPKQLSQRSKNIVTLEECRPKSQGVRGAGVGPYMATPREHLERGHGFWHLFGLGRSGYITDPSTVFS